MIKFFFLRLLIDIFLISTAYYYLYVTYNIFIVTILLVIYLGLLYYTIIHDDEVEKETKDEVFIYPLDEDKAFVGTSEEYAKFLEEQKNGQTFGTKDQV